MPVDLDALRKISEGDPNTRVTVSRRWLREVHRMLVTPRDTSMDFLETLLNGRRRYER